MPFALLRQHGACPRAAMITDYSAEHLALPSSFWLLGRPSSQKKETNRNETAAQ